MDEEEPLNLGEETLNLDTEEGLAPARVPDFIPDAEAEKFFGADQATTDPYAAKDQTEHEQETYGDDDLTTGAITTPQAPKSPEFIPDSEAAKFFGSAATPNFIPDAEADKFFGTPKPGAADDSQFRGYIPTALRKAVQAMLQIDIPVEKGLARLIFGDEDNWLYQNAKWRGENAQGFVDTSPLRTTKAENESITGRAAETLGNLAPLFLLGGGLGGVAAASIQMGASGVEAGAQRAKTVGANPEQQYQQGLAEGAIGLGVGAATMGAATLLKPFARSGPGMMNWAQTTLKEAAREGAVFGTAMEAQEYLAEKAAQVIYDPKAEYHFDMVRFLSGLAAGGAIGGTRGAFQRYRAGNPTTGEAPPPDMAPPEGSPAEQRQEAKGAPPVNLNVGTASENVKPSKVDETVGNPQSTPASDAGNTGRWAKRQARRVAGEEVLPESKTGVTVLDKGQIDPTFVEALAPLKRPAPPEPTGEPPAAPRSSDSAPPPAESPKPPWFEQKPEIGPGGVEMPVRPEPVAPPVENRSEPVFGGDRAKIREAMDDPNSPHYEPPEPEQGIGHGTPEQYQAHLEGVNAPRGQEAPRYTPRLRHEEQQDVVIPHPEYLRSADNPPLKETPSLGSPRPEITNQRAPQGSTGVPVPVKPHEGVFAREDQADAVMKIEAATTALRARGLEAIAKQIERTATGTSFGREVLGYPEAAVAMADRAMAMLNKSKLRPKVAEPIVEAPRKPRMLEDLSAPPREFSQFQGQREELRAPKTQEEAGPPSAEYQLQKGQYPIKDASDRVIGGHKMEAEARKLTNRLKKAGELMNGDRFPFEGEKYDPRKPVDMKAYRDRAVEIVKTAKEEGWEDYFPKQKVADEAYRVAPAEAIFMREMLSLAKKPFNPERSAKTLERELDLRMGPEGVEAVRSQRRGDTHNVEFDENQHSDIQSSKRDTAMSERETTLPEGDTGHVYSGRKRTDIPVKTLKSEKLSTALRPEEYGQFDKELARQLAEGQPDTRVHTVSDAQMKDIAKAAWGDDNTIGVWGLYDPLTQNVFVRHGAPPDTLLHEALHANVDRKLLTDPQARAEVQKLIDAVKGDERLAAIEGGYPLSDVREFLAHGMTHPEFRVALSQIKLDPTVAKELGLPKWRNATGFKAFVNAIKRVLGLGDEHYSALEGVIKVSEGLIKTPETTAQRKSLADFREGKTNSWPPEIQSGRVEEKIVKDMERDAEGLLKQVRGAKTISQWPTHTIAQHADKFGKEFGKQAHIMAEQVERGGARAHEITNEDSKTVGTLVKLSEKDPARFAEFDDMMAKMSNAGIWGDLPVNKQGFKLDPATKAWSEAQHPDIKAWVDRMTPEEKDAYAEYHDLMDTRQEAISKETAKNISDKFAGVADKAQLERVRNDTMTAADEAAIPPEVARLIKNAYTAADYKRPYVPSERGGDKWAVTGQQKVAAPDASLNPVSTTPLAGRSRPTYEFRSKAEGEKYQAANKDGGEARISRGYWVDKDTGKRFSVDKNGKQITLSEKDPNVEKRWEVSVQDQRVEFFDTEHEAAAREKALHESGTMVDGSTNIQPKTYNNPKTAEALASQVGFNVEKLLRNNDNYQRMSKSDQAAVRHMLNESHIELLGSTRSHNARLRRQNVHGADTDLIQGLLNYSQRTSHELARLEVMPKHDAAREEMSKMVNDKSERALSTARKRVLNELDRRSNAWRNDDYNLARSAYGPYVHRLTGMSAVMRLLTPGFWIRNSTQIGTHGGTRLGAEYGQGPGWRELYKVGKQTGYGKLLKEGFKEMGRVFKGDDTPANLFSEFKSTLKTDFDREAADYAAETKTIDRDASMDMSDYVRNPKGVKLDIGRGESKVRDALEAGLTSMDKRLEWLQKMSRAPTAAIETWMRGTMFVAAARLEFKRNGGDKEAAFRKAKDLVDDAMVRYTKTDRPLWQRHPLAAVPLQFKTFGFTQYAIYGRNLGRMIKNADPADRHIALMTLGGLAASHMIVSGLMGLPTEPARLLLLGARAMGLTNKEWDDVDHYVRNLTSQALGPTAGTALAKGLPQLLNIDLSSGLGADNLLTGFSPRYATDRDFDQGMWAWAAKQMGGAPASMVMDMMGGVREAMNGNPMKAFQKMVPVKALSDVAKAGVGYAEGKRSDRGRQMSEPYTATEAISKAMGLPVARESNEQARNAYWAMYTKREQAERSKLVAAYVGAKDPEARQQARQAAMAGGIKGDELAKAVTAEKSLERRVRNGVVTNSRNKAEAGELDRIYNTGKP